ncbi:hypothetical protein G7076_04120 [Sphingomonas sp. HDW15A]|uniref:hypothetical protein n=1 Tax=Sphingomonas sp. HDW15A TaxID=2714942 RepID=UPI00140C3F33|nr:hypothetical protein [Sphingomonas sp. HDW15A]QIK95761.1 hypothetical protein G7076_04120 [Sphingomonas sp. HDW15A]
MGNWSTANGSFECEIGGVECDIPRQHEIDLALCADLEGLADTLPDLHPDSDLRRLTERLRSAAARWGSNEVTDRMRSLEHALDCRLLDAIHAEDVIDALWAYWRKPTHTDAECLSYMLRALFDGRRRAIAIERLALGCSDCQSSATD